MSTWEAESLFTYQGKKSCYIFISLPGFFSYAEQVNDLEFNEKNLDQEVLPLYFIIKHH